jgi:hypothetical protein
VEDDCLAPDILLHITYEVVSQLDRAEESKCLSSKEHSLCYFLVEQVGCLQFIVQVQDDSAPSLAQDSIASAQGSCPPQPGVASVGHFSGVVAESSHAPLMRDGGQVVELSCS